MKTITVEQKNGVTHFSLEIDGVKRSASFGKGHSSYVEGSSGHGGEGISQSVRSLAKECRIELGACRDALEIA